MTAEPSFHVAHYNLGTLVRAMQDLSSLLLKKELSWVATTSSAPRAQAGTDRGGAGCSTDCGRTGPRVCSSEVSMLGSVSASFLLILAIQPNRHGTASAQQPRRQGHARGHRDESWKGRGRSVGPLQRCLRTAANGMPLPLLLSPLLTAFWSQRSSWPMPTAVFHPFLKFCRGNGPSRFLCQWQSLATNMHARVPRHRRHRCHCQTYHCPKRSHTEPQL